MNVSKDNIKDELHRIIDSLTPEETIAARHYLKYLLSVASRKRQDIRQVLANAPYDDEPLTEEDIRDIEEARKDIENGETVSMDEVKRMLGL
jgi:hypothetical protein